jgi:hypothetical protein
VNEDIGATFVRLDKAEALVGIEEFYSASLGHASGPFVSARHPHGQHYAIAFLRRRWQAILKCEKKVPSTSAGSRQDLTPAVFWDRLTGILAFPARKFLRTSHARKMPERAKSAAFEGFWQAKVF